MKPISRTKSLDLGRELKIANGAMRRGDGRKKEREEEEREREGLPYSARESRQAGWRDS
jgi:hypothetical protein